MVTITTPTTREQFKAYYNLRYKTFSEPAGHPRGTEKDDYEPISDHFMAVTESGEVVGAAKLFEKSPGVGHLSQLAVAPEYQHKGIGRLLMQAVEQRAREKGYKAIGISARLTATAYFEKHGFHMAGLPALHLGTTHLVWMEKSLEQ